MPYTWSGGGGPSGNRYFLSIYPALFFIMPPLGSMAPAVVAWLGGALFTAHILINPFVSAKRPYLSVERGALRAGNRRQFTGAIDPQAMQRRVGFGR